MGKLAAQSGAAGEFCTKSAWFGVLHYVRSGFLFGALEQKIEGKPLLTVSCRSGGFFRRFFVCQKPGGGSNSGVFFAVETANFKIIFF